MDGDSLVGMGIPLEERTNIAPVVSIDDWSKVFERTLRTYMTSNMNQQCKQSNKALVVISLEKISTIQSTSLEQSARMIQRSWASRFSETNGGVGLLST